MSLTLTQKPFAYSRFGLAGGLAWLGVLTVGVVGEQIKTRLESAREEAGTMDVRGALVSVSRVILLLSLQHYTSAGS